MWASCLSQQLVLDRLVVYKATAKVEKYVHNGKGGEADDSQGSTHFYKQPSFGMSHKLEGESKSCNADGECCNFQQKDERAENSVEELNMKANGPQARAVLCNVPPRAVSVSTANVTR